MCSIWLQTKYVICSHYTDASRATKEDVQRKFRTAAKQIGSGNRFTNALFVGRTEIEGSAGIPYLKGISLVEKYLSNRKEHSHDQSVISFNLADKLRKTLLWPTDLESTGPKLREDALAALKLLRKHASDTISSSPPPSHPHHSHPVILFLECPSDSGD